MTPEQRAVMQQALDVLQKGDVLCEFVACKILSAELAKPDLVLLARQQINLEKETLDSDLDSRMREAGMMPLSEMLKSIPLQRWLTHTGVNDMESFEAWLRMRRDEMLRMQVRMELDKRQNDEMYEWVIAHTAVFTEVLCNFQAAAIGEAKQ